MVCLYRLPPFPPPLPWILGVSLLWDSQDGPGYRLCQGILSAGQDDSWNSTKEAVSVKGALSSPLNPSWQGTDWCARFRNNLTIFFQIKKNSYWVEGSIYPFTTKVKRISLVAQWQRICLPCWRGGFHPRVGKMPWRREWLPTQVFLPEKFHGQRSPVGYSPWGHKSQTWLSD